MSEKKRNRKTIWITLALVLVFIVILPFALIGFFIADSVKSITDSFGYSNEDIMEYVDDQYDIEVAVLSNPGRDAGSKGLKVNDARVQTLDEDKLEFDIHINTFGMITGDTYEIVKMKHDLNKQYRGAQLFKQLSALGFEEISFGKEAEDPPLHLSLPEEVGMADTEAHEMMYEALPILKEIRTETAALDYEMDTVSVNGATLHVTVDYQSVEDLANQLASENIDFFTYPFIEEDRKPLEPIQETIAELGFHDNELALQCEEMVVYTECNTYSIQLSPVDSMELRYDSEDDKDTILSAVHEIQTIDLPINHIKIHSVYTPADPLYQLFDEEELKERGESGFGYRTVSLRNLDDIDSIEDLFFEY